MNAKASIFHNTSDLNRFLYPMAVGVISGEITIRYASRGMAEAVALFTVIGGYALTVKFLIDGDYLFEDSVSFKTDYLNKLKDIEDSAKLAALKVELETEITDLVAEIYELESNL